MQRDEQGMLIFFAAIAVAGVVFWVVLPGGPETVTQWDVTVGLGGPGLTPVKVGNVTYWNASVVVTGVQPDGYDVPWSEVEVVLRSANGDVLFSSGDIRDLGTSGGALDADGVMPAAWYVRDGAGGPSSISRGGTVVLSGLTTVHQGTELELWWRDARIGVTVLPSTFA